MSLTRVRYFVSDSRKWLYRPILENAADICDTTTINVLNVLSSKAPGASSARQRIPRRWLRVRRGTHSQDASVFGRGHSSDQIGLSTMLGTMIGLPLCSMYRTICVCPMVSGNCSAPEKTFDTA